MTVLTKTKKRYLRPKCEQIAAYSGQRCKFNAIQHVDGQWRCRRHPGTGK